MTTERVLQIFVNALPHVSIAFFVAALIQILYVTLSDIGKSPKIGGEFCYSPKTALIPQTSHLTVIKTTNSSCQQENKFVKKSKPSPRRIIASYYMYSMGGLLTFNVNTSSSCCEWTGMCCRRLFSSQYSSFSGRCASW